MILDLAISNVIYFFLTVIFTLGLLMILSSDNYINKLLGLGVIQISVLILYLILGKVNFVAPPIDYKNNLKKNIDLTNSDNVIEIYCCSSPLPQVLMLTAIVVGFSVMSVGLVLIYLISKNFYSILESEVKSSKLEYDFDT